MRHDSQRVMTSLTQLLAVGATLLLSAPRAEPASFAYAVSGSSVSVIHTANPSVVARIPTGLSAFGGLAVDPSGQRVYRANFEENTVAVIDTASHTVIGQIPVSRPQRVLVHPSRRVAYVTGTTSEGDFAGLLAIIDTVTNTVTTTIPLGRGVIVGDMVLHPAGTKLYVSGGTLGSGSMIVVIDTSTHAVTTTVSVEDAGMLATHPMGTFVYVLNVHGVSVLDTSTDTIVATIPASQLPSAPTNVVVHPHGTFLYVITVSSDVTFGQVVGAQQGTVAVVDTRTHRVVATIALPSLIPVAAALIPSGTRLYVSGEVPFPSCFMLSFCPFFSQRAAGTAVIDTTTNVVLTIVPSGPFDAGGGPVAVDPSGHNVYANAGGLTVIDAATNAVTATLPTGDVVFGPTVLASPGNQVFYTIRSRDGGQQGTQWGAPGDRPVPADYDGDGRADVAVWRPSTGEWFVLSSRTGTVTSMAFGAPGDVPVPHDYDGDGKADLAVWRPNDPSATQGVWFILHSSDGRVSVQPWGARGDLPLPADFDGDGKADLTVYRP